MIQTDIFPQKREVRNLFIIFKKISPVVPYINSALFSIYVNKLHGMYKNSIDFLQVFHREENQKEVGERRENISHIAET